MSGANGRARGRCRVVRILRVSGFFARLGPLDIARLGSLNIAGFVSLSIVDGSSTGRETYDEMSIGRAEGIPCLPSTKGAIVIRTPRLELLQPLDRCGVSASHGCSGGHEEHACQQGQDEDEPLGVHRESSGVEVEA